MVLILAVGFDNTQELAAAHVRFGSLADIAAAVLHVRFTPKRWGNRPAACG